MTLATVIRNPRMNMTLATVISKPLMSMTLSTVIRKPLMNMTLATVPVSSMFGRAPSRVRSTFSRLSENKYEH